MTSTGRVKSYTYGFDRDFFLGWSHVNVSTVDGTFYKKDPRHLKNEDATRSGLSLRGRLLSTCSVDFKGDCVMSYAFLCHH